MMSCKQYRKTEKEIYIAWYNKFQLRIYSDAFWYYLSKAEVQKS